MKNLPLLSVIVPVYNTMEYLEKCVRSIMNQTYGNLEILLVDDGSTDASGAMCDALAGEDARIRVLHKENGGSSSARNLGIDQARGEYLGFVDSDDFIEPDMYERLEEGLRGGYEIAQIGRNEIDEAGNLLPDICIPPATEEEVSSRDFMRELLMHRGDCSFCTKLIKREVFADLRFPEGLLNEDFWLFIQMLPRTAGVVSLPGYKYHVFYRLGSNSRRKDKNDFSRVFGDCVDNAGLAEELVRTHYPELLPVAKRFQMFQRIEYLLHIPILQMTGENRQYRDIVLYIRKHYFEGLTNPYLTKKNKLYLTLFAVAPKTVRQVHAKIKRL